jgi:hypothetical protein
MYNIDTLNKKFDEIEQEFGRKGKGFLKIQRYMRYTDLE